MCLNLLLKKSIHNSIIPIVICCLWSCEKRNFNEYPPSIYLSDKAQLQISDKLMYSIDKVDLQIDQSDLELLRGMYKLQYYTKVKGKEYFLISRKVHFLNSGLLCYGGEINTQAMDTTFNIYFKAEVTTEYTEDSVKFLFKKMLRK